jgi:hypothetical protein
MAQHNRLTVSQGLLNRHRKEGGAFLVLTLKISRGSTITLQKENARV